MIHALKAKEVAAISVAMTFETQYGWKGLRGFMRNSSAGIV
jgi:hypothetical protein